MALKKNELKFTIVFNAENPDHVFAAKMINAQGRVGKANYIAEAIRSHEGNNVVDMNTIFNLVSSLKQESGLMIDPKAPADTTIDNKGVQNIASDLDGFRNKR